MFQQQQQVPSAPINKPTATGEFELESVGGCSVANEASGGQETSSQAITTTNGTTSIGKNQEASTKTTTTTKLNGLKNRILQRPPPLILDKVSNFYNAPHHHEPSLSSDASRPPQEASAGLERQTTTTANEQPSANHKFWASLNNQNAVNSRQNPPLLVGIRQQATNDDDGNLGADLIITHRNSTGSLGNRQPRISTSTSLLLQQKQHQSSKTSNSDNNNKLMEVVAFNGEQHETNNSVITVASGRLHDLSNTSEMDDSSTHGGAASETDGGNLIGVDNSTPPPPPPLAIPPVPVSKRSASGIDYAPSLASQQQPQSSPCHRPALVVSVMNEQPPSAGSNSINRPRSNNPFIAMDEELVFNMEANLNKRPSFVADTCLSQQISAGRQQHQQFNAAQLDHHHQQQQNQTNGFSVIQKQFSNMHLHGAQLENPYCTNDELIDQQQQQQQAAQDQRDGSLYKSSLLMAQQQLQQQQQSIYGVYFDRHHQHRDSNSSVNGHHHNQSYVNYEPTISFDSESAVCKPPPSATMQLPHWTDAIYELNNAILESSSVAGGAENGQFIYISESGDIILELDHIKVSGFTLVEFNELLETKPVHLLNAIQTKHSQGLTTDLKHYLNCSFPKNSNDKELQDLIRENIYRRTIPCTTRPQKEGELDKVDYHFLTKEHFVEMNNRGMLLECGMFGGHYYGTMKPFSDLNSLSIYGSMDGCQKELTEDMRQPLQASHPAISLAPRGRDQFLQSVSNPDPVDPLYENHESLKMHHQHQQQMHGSYKLAPTTIANSNINSTMLEDHYGQLTNCSQKQEPNILAIDSEALPMGWERVIDQTHGTYYIDHNTQRTQYERPYEIELTKGAMGFGFTLVEADNGVLLVRSIIPGGPANLNGMINPGDILISAVGVPVANLQHTDIARLFSTFAVGDRVRLTFARSAYVVDANLVPDEYLFSNGTNGDLAVSLNSSSYFSNYFSPNMLSQETAQSIQQSEHDFLNFALTKGESGFGFTIVDPGDGSQRVKEIQNTETSTKLKQGDVLISLNGQDITKLTHKEVVERLKNCQVGQDVSLVVKRKKRFRSKTPMATRSKSDEYALDSTPQRNCKTPSLDGLMLRRSSNNRASFISNNNIENNLMPKTRTQQLPQMVSQFIQPPTQPPQPFAGASQHHQLVEQSLGEHQQLDNYGVLTSHIPSATVATESIYSTNSAIMNDTNKLYYQQPQHQLTTQPSNMTLHQGTNYQLSNSLVEPKHNRVSFRPFGGVSGGSVTASDGLVMDNITNSIHPSETSLPPMKFAANVTDLTQMNQYNNFMNNDKLVMMQMQVQQQRYQQQQSQNSDYHQMPLYSNSDILKQQEANNPSQMVQPFVPNMATTKPPPPPPLIHQYHPESIYSGNNCSQNNYYANNEEIALQSVQYGSCSDAELLPMNSNQATHFMEPNLPPALLHHRHQPTYGSYQQNQSIDLSDSLDQYEIHQVDLDRESKDTNWGIRLIGGSEVDRAISIGSIVFGGAASKNGLLKSGDEIISINGYNVVGATHQHVVDLISACPNRASLVVKRKKFAEACEVVLTRNMDEGFGFVIISSHNCALIGSIIEGSPADRCQQLHVKDRIIAVNGNYITPDMQHPEIVNLIKECGSTLRLRIIPADCYTVKLIKNSQQDNFGFSMRGGSEYDGTPLYILKVAPEGLARDLLNVGDQIIEINGIPTVGMTHQQAATLIKYSDPIVKLKLRRNYVIPPSLLVASPKELSKFNQVTAEMKTVNPIPTPNYLAQDELAPVPPSAEISSFLSHHHHHHHQHGGPMMILADADQQQRPSSLTSAPTTPTTSAAAVHSNSVVYRQSLPLYAT